MKDPRFILKLPFIILVNLVLEAIALFAMFIMGHSDEIQHSFFIGSSVTVALMLCLQAYLLRSIHNWFSQLGLSCLMAYLTWTFVLISVVSGVCTFTDIWKCILITFVYGLGFFIVWIPLGVLNFFLMRYFLK